MGLNRYFPGIFILFSFFIAFIFLLVCERGGETRTVQKAMYANSMKVKYSSRDSIYKAMAKLLRLLSSYTNKHFVYEYDSIVNQIHGGMSHRERERERETFKQLLGHFWVALQSQFICQLYAILFMCVCVCIWDSFFILPLNFITTDVNFILFSLSLSLFLSFLLLSYSSFLSHFSDEFVGLRDKKPFSNYTKLYTKHTHPMHFYADKDEKETPHNKNITALIFAKLANGILSQSFRRIYTLIRTHHTHTYKLSFSFTHSLFRINV